MGAAHTSPRGLQHNMTDIYLRCVTFAHNASSDRNPANGFTFHFSAVCNGTFTPTMLKCSIAVFHNRYSHVNKTIYPHSKENQQDIIFYHCTLSELRADIVQTLIYSRSFSAGFAPGRDFGLRVV